MDSPTPHPVHWIVLILILLAALLARCYQIGSESLWTDEFLSLEVSAGHGYEHQDFPRGVLFSPPPHDVSGIASEGSWRAFGNSLRRSTHPPLYFTALRLWRELLQSDGDSSARLLSTLVSLIGIGLAFDAVRILHRSVAAALWAAALLAVANVQVQFAQEARGYALLVMFMFGAVAAVARAQRYGLNPKRLLALALCTAGMIATHYLGLTLIAALAVYQSIFLRGSARRRCLLVQLGVPLILLACWWPILSDQLHAMSQRLAWMKEAPEGHLSNTMQRLALLPTKFFVDPGWRPVPACYFFGLVFLAPLLRLRQRPELMVWALIAAFVVISVTAGDLWRTTMALQYPRYTVAAAAAASLLLLLTLHDLPQLTRLGRILAPAGLVAACALALPLSYHREKPDWRALAQYINRHCDTDAAVVFYPNTKTYWYSSLLALEASHYVNRHDRPEVVLSQPADERLVEQLRRRGTVTLISGSLEPQEVLPGCVMKEMAYFPMIGVCSRVEFPGEAARTAANTAAVSNAEAHASALQGR